MATRRDASGGLRSLGRALLRNVRRDFPNEQELARFIGVGRATLSRWLNGREVPVKYMHRKALRDRCGVGLDTWEITESALGPETDRTSAML
jgi:transcriptional regulator with XRE-family HTH domain